MRRKDPAKDRGDGEAICSFCGCVAADGHECDKRRASIRDAAMKRDDDATLERQRSFGERLTYAEELMDDDDPLYDWEE